MRVEFQQARVCSMAVKCGSLGQNVVIAELGLLGCGGCRQSYVNPEIDVTACRDSCQVLLASRSLVQPASRSLEFRYAWL